MVNYFDIATPEEIREQFDEALTPAQIAIKRASFSEFHDANYAHLYFLYLNRGDEIKANEYLNLINDDKYKFTISMHDVIDL